MARYIRWIRRHLAVVLVAGAVGIVGAVGGVTVAMADIPDSGVIHGCYKATGPHVLSVIDTDKGQVCPSGTKALSWNQSGPQGMPGPGLTFTVAQGGDVTAGVGSFETAILTCPPSDPLMISGGYEIENSQTSPTDYTVVFDMPVNANSWEVRIAVPPTAPTSVTWLVQGVCANQS